MKKVFKVKNRPLNNPIITHVGKSSWVSGMTEPEPRAKLLIKEFWPGPLTLILRKRSDCPISDYATAKLETIAVRQPKNEIALRLLLELGKPIAAPSANISGKVSSTNAGHVQNDFGDEIDFILNAGECETGIESTVIDLTDDEPTILRPGAISIEKISHIIGKTKYLFSHEAKPRSPGLLPKHYSPDLPLRINATKKEQKNEVLIGFGQNAKTKFNLSPRGDLSEAAKNLYSTLRHVDDNKRFTCIAINPIPNHGIGVAINDRLCRASEGQKRD